MTENKTFEPSNTCEYGDEEHMQQWEQEKKHLAKSESIADEDVLESSPYYLLARRSVQHLYKQINTGGSLPVANLMETLGFQMRASIQDLMADLREQGRDYDMLLQGGFEGEKGRWKLLINGKSFAVIDKDFGFDCFDVSSTQFKDKIAELIDRAEQKSKIHPLNEQERQDLDNRIAREPEEWGRLFPDENHGIGLGEEMLKRLVHKPQEGKLSIPEDFEFNKFIISMLFKSKKIRNHLIQQKIDPETQALLVFTADASLENKLRVFMKLIKKEEQRIQDYASQIDKFGSLDGCSSEECTELQQKMQDSSDARQAFISYFEFIDNALKRFFPIPCVEDSFIHGEQGIVDSQEEMQGVSDFGVEEPREDKCKPGSSGDENLEAALIEAGYIWSGKSEEGKLESAPLRSDEPEPVDSCLLCTFYKHNEFYELDGALGLGAQFEKQGFIKLISGISLVDDGLLSYGPERPTLQISGGDNTTFAQVKPWDVEWPFPPSRDDDEYNDESDDNEDGEDLNFYYEDGFIRLTDGRDFTEVIKELLSESDGDNLDDQASDDVSDIAGLVGYTGKGSKLSFVLSDNSGHFVFGQDDERLTALQSLFVGLFKQGDILSLDFEPFYRKREGVVLKPAYRVISKSEDYVISDMVLTKVGPRWACGDLAGRFFFGGIDPVGYYFNSYSAIKESYQHQNTHDMIALEALIGTFLYWAQNGCDEDEEEEFITREDAADEAEYYILEAVQLRLAEDPTLADRIIRAFDWSPQFGLTDEELLELCGLEV